MEILELPDDVTPDTYVSFSVPGQFLGAVVAPTPDPDEAMTLITAAGLNPGGQGVIFLVPPGEYPHLQLMTKEDLVRIQGEATRLGDLPADQRDAVEKNSLLVCECCNRQQPTTN